MKKLHWSDLDDTEKVFFCVERGCGPGKTFFLIPQFIFKASCCQHDFYYARGGDVFDKMMADAMFYAYMLKDIADTNHGFLDKLKYATVATAYYLFVSIFGCLFFKFGKYRTMEEILKS